VPVVAAIAVFAALLVVPAALAVDRQLTALWLRDHGQSP
jgi:hypothetical protein